MASDEETKKTKPLPARVERALALAREAANADRERKGGRWLAVFPISVAVILMFLLMPRATTPESIPLPRTNLRVLDEIARADDARADAAEKVPLPSDVLAVGSGVRALNGAEARGVDEPGVADARRQLDSALRDVAQRKDITSDLLSLRALQMRRFLIALAHWEATGEVSEDFVDLAAAFVARASDAGWLEGRRVILSDAERRVMFKTVWNVLIGIDASRPSPSPRAALAMTLDEQRALYTFYLQHPHPSEARRVSLEAQRQSARTAEACASANVEQRRQTELWRADKIKRLGAIDPDYPTSYALGVAYWHAGRFDLSADAFTTFIGQHPDGPYALRARNHLKAAVAGGP